MKNYIIIVEKTNGKREEHKLYNFSEVVNTWIDHKSYIRVLCDGRFYYFRSTFSIIKEIKIFKESK